MIIDRYLRREILLSLVGVSMVLLIILISLRLIGILSEASTGALPVDYILVLLALRNVSNLETVLPLALFIGTLLALSRLYIDNEMTALAACGIGVGRILRTVMQVSVVVAGVVAVLALYASPWAELQSQHIMDKGAADKDAHFISAGNFKDISGGNGVIYVQKVMPSGQGLENVFVQNNQQVGNTVISAASGRRYYDAANGVSYLELQNGYRYDGTPGQADYTVTHFAKHGVRLREETVPASATKRKAMPTLSLWRKGTVADIAEIQWRLSSVIWVFVLAMVAVPLSHTSPRQGRYAKIFSAILIYIIYSNFLSMAKSWMVNREISPLLGLWWVHALMVLLAVIMLQLRAGGRLSLGRRK